MFGTDTNLSFWGWLKRHIVWLTIIPVLLSMWVIFGFSAQPAEQSSQTSHGLVEVVIRLLVPDFDGLDATRQAEITHRVTYAVRKTAHAVEYAVLGFFLELHFTVARWRRSNNQVETEAQTRTERSTKSARISEQIARMPIWLWSVLIGFVYAITDEVHQSFVADRGPGVYDVGVDTLGVIAGVAVCGLIWQVSRRMARRHSQAN